jgi:hypothetical protein
LSIVTCDYRRGLQLNTGVTDHFNTQLLTTLYHNAFANFHTLQFTRAHAEFFFRPVMSSLDVSW